MTFVSSNDIITIKIDKKCKKWKDKQTKKIIQNKNLDCQVDIRETNWDYEMEKRKFANIHFKKNVLRQLLFLEIVSSLRFRTNCVDVKTFVYLN